MCCCKDTSSNYVFVSASHVCHLHCTSREVRFNNVTRSQSQKLTPCNKLEIEMGKSNRSKVIDPESGKITITTIEERYPLSTEVLMDNGFGIILLNMVFGLLPTTLFGSRLQYYRCSVAQAYALVFGLCMIILSVVFLPLSIKVSLMDNPNSNGRTDVAVLMLGKLTHVFGFLFLLIRGYYVARKLPVIWTQLAKLVQISVIELHGKQYRGLKKLKSFARYAIITYILTMIANELNVFSHELNTMMPQFFIYYNLQLIEIAQIHYYGISGGFYIWKLCSFSHILVSIMAGFIIVAVTVCLQAGNDHLLGIFDDDKNLLLIRKRKKIVLKEIQDNFEDTNEEQNSPKRRDENKIVQALNQVKNIHVVAENLLGSISKVLGVTLIVEVLILIANLLVDIFYMLVPVISPSPGGDGWDDDPPFPESGDNYTILMYRQFFKNHFASENGSGGESDGDANGGGLTIAPFSSNPSKLLTLAAEAFIHSYFFYKLCCRVTEMVNEAKEPLQILKTVSYANFSKKVQRQISVLKGDLASSNNITLTAASYFQINKFTLTSVTSALTTYIIVLLQFSQQEAQSN